MFNLMLPHGYKRMMVYKPLFNKHMFKFFCDKSTPREQRNKFFSPDSPYVKEVTDAIYPKLLKSKRIITNEDIQSQFDEVNKFIKSKDFNNAFILSNALLNDSLLFKDNDINLLSIYNIMGGILFEMKDYTSAVEKYLQSLELFINLKEEQMENKDKNCEDDLKFKIMNSIQDSLFKIGISYSLLKDFESSNKYLLKLIYSDKVKVNKNDKAQFDFYIKILKNIAINFYNLKDYDKSIKFFKNVLTDMNAISNEVSDGSSDTKVKSFILYDVYNHLGSLLMSDSSNFDESCCDYFEKAYNLLKNDFDSEKEEHKEDRLKIYFSSAYNLASIRFQKEKFQDSLNLSLTLEKSFSKISLNKNYIPDTSLDQMLIELHSLIIDNLNFLNKIEESLHYHFKLLKLLKTHLNFNLKGNKPYIKTLDRIYFNSLSIFINNFKNLKDNPTIINETCENLISYCEMNIQPILTSESESLAEKYYSILDLCHNFSLTMLSNVGKVPQIDKIEETMHKILFLIETYNVSDMRLKSGVLLFLSSLSHFKGEDQVALHFLDRICELTNKEEFKKLFITNLSEAASFIMDVTLLYSNLAENMYISNAEKTIEIKEKSGTLLRNTISEIKKEDKDTLNSTKEVIITDLEKCLNIYTVNNNK